MRWYCALPAVLLFSVMGYVQASKIKDRRELLGGFLYDIHSLGLMIEFTSRPVRELIKTVSAQSKISVLWSEILLKIDNGSPVKTAWCEVKKDTDTMNRLGMGSEEETLADEFFSMLGESDRDAQSKGIAMICKQLDELKSRKENELEKKEKLIMKLLPCLGLAIGILLL